MLYALLLTGSWRCTQGAEVRETAGTSCRPLCLPLSQLSQHLLHCSNIHHQYAPPDTVTVVARGCECQGLEITGVSNLHVSRKSQQLLQERKVVGMSSAFCCSSPEQRLAQVREWGRGRRWMKRKDGEGKILPVPPVPPPPPPHTHTHAHTHTPHTHMHTHIHPFSSRYFLWQKTCWGLRGGRKGRGGGEDGWETGADDLRHIEIWLKK